MIKKTLATIALAATLNSCATTSTYKSKPISTTTSEQYEKKPCAPKNVGYELLKGVGKMLEFDQGYYR